jgi:hypothetical protein
MDKGYDPKKVDSIRPVRKRKRKKILGKYRRQLD